MQSVNTFFGTTTALSGVAAYYLIQKAGSFSKQRDIIWENITCNEDVNRRINELLQSLTFPRTDDSLQAGMIDRFTQQLSDYREHGTSFPECESLANKQALNLVGGIAAGVCILSAFGFIATTAHINREKKFCAAVDAICKTTLAITISAIAFWAMSGNSLKTD